MEPSKAVRWFSTAIHKLIFTDKFGHYVLARINNAVLRVCLEVDAEESLWRAIPLGTGF